MHSIIRARGSLASMRKLVEQAGPELVNEADTSRSHQSPLHVAAFEPDVDPAVLRFLMAKGASVNATDQEGWTPLHCAANAGNVEAMLELLSCEDVDVNVVTSSGTAPLHYLSRTNVSSWDDTKVKLFEDVVVMMMSRDADVDIQNDVGETPLHQACMRVDPKVPALLLEHGASPHIENHKGETPLHYAVRTGLVDTVQLLLDAGASPTVLSDSGTALQMADPRNKELTAMLSAAVESEGEGGGDTPTSSVRHRSHSVLQNQMGPSMMPPRQRRLRHVQHVLCRNLSGCADAMNTYFTIHEGPLAQTQDAPPMYRSEVVHRSRNPHWSEMARSQHITECRSSVFSLRVYNAAEACGGGAAQSPYAVYWIDVAVNDPSLMDDSQSTLLLALEVNLVDLCFIGASLAQQKLTFFPNTVILRFADGYYVSSACADRLMQARILNLRALSSQVTYSPLRAAERMASLNMHTYSLSQLQSLLTLRKEEIRLTSARTVLRTQVEQALLAQQQHRSKLVSIAAKRKQVAQKREELEALKQQLAEERAVTQALREDHAPRARALAKRQMKLLKGRERLEALQSDIQQLRQQNKDVHEQLRHRKGHMLSALHRIYPIEPPPNPGGDAALPKWRIRSLALPNSDFAGCDEEEVATALGYVCHSLYLISKWFAVPLPYGMIPMCSRSVIRDDISHQASPKFPLYSRVGVERTRFEYAVFLLNKNLDQLLNSQHSEVITLRHTLPNLHRLQEVFAHSIVQRSTTQQPRATTGARGHKARGAHSDDEPAS